jgi:hypothetical protein
MFIDKRLKQMSPHGLTFGEHCVNLDIDEFSQNMLDLLRYRPIDTVFMRNGAKYGYQKEYTTSLSWNH